jgi:beta-glucosidase
VTFYRSVADLPDFEDYSMEGRTYRYFRGMPVYAFGHGLSYTDFNYSDLRISRLGDGSLMVSVKVTNSGERDGDEVVQLYISNDRKFRTPIRSLKGFDRISLKAGESMDVVFTVAPDELTVVDQKGASVPMKGRITVSVGGGQPGYASDCLMTEVNYRR